MTGLLVVAAMAAVGWLAIRWDQRRRFDRHLADAVSRLRPDGKFEWRVGDAPPIGYPLRDIVIAELPAEWGAQVVFDPTDPLCRIKGFRCGPRDLLEGRDADG